MSDYFDYPQDARDTRQPTSPHLRFLPEDDCDCGHKVSQHSSEGGVGCLHVVHKFHSLERPGHVSSALTCPCLRTGTSRADQ